MRKANYLMMFIVAVGLFGCDAKVKQCNDLIAVINQNQEFKKKASAIGAKAEPKDFVALADDLDKLKEKIGGVKLKDEKLKGFVKEYQDLLAETGKALRDRAKAIEGKDQAALDKSVKDLGATQTKEGLIVDKINKYCTGK